MDSITISVTNRDIEAGKRYSSTDCPLALAVKRVVKGYQVFVTPALLHIRNYDEDAYYVLPENAKQFMHRFDHATWDDFESHADPIIFTVTKKELR